MHTLLFLIPKKHNGKVFGDYRPISCYNVVYKLIIEVIARRLKPILSEIIGEEQFGFLQNRHSQCGNGNTGSDSFS
jgi:hypothetical protein